MAIYARLENGTYAEVTGVYKTDGTEVTEIFQGDRLVYSASNEIYGSLPLYYNGKGYDLTDYLISGNAVQDGTPSADAPVDAVGCGVRTENLFDYTDRTEIIDNRYINQNGNMVESDGYYISYPIEVEAGATYTWRFNSESISALHTAPTVGYYDSNNTLIGVASHSSNVRFFSFAIPTGCEYIRCSVYKRNGVQSEAMLNLGSTALPYEPYGYKLPLTVNGVEYPIYLGQVETTRRIKKLVLTGEEYWQSYSDASGTWQFYLNNIQLGGVTQSSCVSNIAPYGVTASTRHRYEYGCYLVTAGSGVGFQMRGAKDTFTDVDTWKSYLAAQYTNGTPVTVWYVLAEPETGIVNEPLMKIGDYADTVSAAQAGVTMPTVNGANVLDMASPVKPSEMYIKGKGIKPTGYGQLEDVNGVNILDKDGRPIYVHGQ